MIDTLKLVRDLYRSTLNAWKMTWGDNAILNYVGQ